MRNISWREDDLEQIKVVAKVTVVGGWRTKGEDAPLAKHVRGAIVEGRRRVSEDGGPA